VMRVLGVVGSPRRGGNTHKLVEAVLDGARSEGAEVELWLLRRLHIQECDGCHHCWTKGCCSKPDDMRDCYPKLAAFDALVLGTPVYWYGPTALMKGFLDRFVYFNCEPHRALVRGKPVALVVPFEDEDLETARPLTMMFEKSLAYLEMPLVGRVLVPGVTERGEVVNQSEAMRWAKRVGAELVRGSAVDGTLGQAGP